MRKAITTALDVGGFACVAVGAFQLTAWAGWVALGASALFISWRQA